EYLYTYLIRIFDLYFLGNKKGYCTLHMNALYRVLCSIFVQYFSPPTAPPPTAPSQPKRQPKHRPTHRPKSTHRPAPAAREKGPTAPPPAAASKAPLLGVIKQRRSRPTPGGRTHRLFERSTLRWSRPGAPKRP